MAKETAAQKKARLAKEAEAKKAAEANATPDEKEKEAPKQPTVEEQMKAMQEQLTKMSELLAKSQADEVGRQKALNLFGHNTATLSDIPTIGLDYILRVEESTRRKNPDTGKWQTRTAVNNYHVVGVVTLPNDQKIVLTVALNEKNEPTDFGFEYLDNFSGNYIHTPTGRSMYVVYKNETAEDDNEQEEAAGE